MTATAALAVIVAALVSVLGTSIIVRPSWSANRKRTVALILALVLGVVAALVSGQISGIPASITHVIQQAVISAAAVVAAAQGFHRQLAGALGVLEKATSPTTTVVTVASDSNDPSEIVLDDDLTEADGYTPAHAEDADETVADPEPADTTAA